MKNKYYKINMDVVRETIKTKGYYYIEAEWLFDNNFIGPKRYIVTDNADYATKNPSIAGMTIMSVKEFEPLAMAVNEFIENEDRERHREKVDLKDDGVKYEVFEESEEKMMIKKAISELNRVQRERLVHYYYGESYGEIAKKQNVSARAVSYSVRAAERKIKELCGVFDKK